MMKVTSVEQYIDTREIWKEALTFLRELFLESELKESIKWGMPVFTLANKNVAGFSAFQSYAELQQAFFEHPELKEKFDVLTPGKQREYAEYISQAKRPSTRNDRIERIIPMIVRGVGLNEQYKP